jgi:hypothetical protein
MKMFGPSSPLSFLAALLLLSSLTRTTVDAFSPALNAPPMIYRPTVATRADRSSSSARATAFMALHMAADKEKQVESAFMPPPDDASEEKESDDDEIPLDKVETLGRGAARVC